MNVKCIQQRQLNQTAVKHIQTKPIESQMKVKHVQTKLINVNQEGGSFEGPNTQLQGLIKSNIGCQNKERSKEMITHFIGKEEDLITKEVEIAQSTSGEDSGLDPP